jgi:hypothetical protein
MKSRILGILYFPSFIMIFRNTIRHFLLFSHVFRKINFNLLFIIVSPLWL